MKAALASLLPRSEDSSEEPPRYANGPELGSVTVRQTPATSTAHTDSLNAVAEIGIAGYDHERYHMRDFVSTPQAQAHALRRVREEGLLYRASAATAGASAHGQATSHGPTGVPPFVQ